jgi:hypothetical protein
LVVTQPTEQMKYQILLTAAAIAMTGLGRGSAAGVDAGAGIVSNGSSLTSYADRMSAARDLSRHLTPGQIEELMDFLRMDPRDDSLGVTELNAVKNEVLVELLKQDRLSLAVIPFVLEALEDEATDPMWREYMLQHLVTCYRRADDPSVRERIVQTLWRAAEERDGTFAGTSLLTLRQVSKDFPASVPPSELQARAAAIAQDREVSQPSRIAAIQVAGRHPGVIAIARQIVQEERDVLLRTAAIPVLGGSSDPADREILRGLSQSPDIRLRMASEAALRGGRTRCGKGVEARSGQAGPARSSARRRCCSRRNCSCSSMRWRSRSSSGSRRCSHANSWRRQRS